MTIAEAIALLKAAHEPVPRPHPLPTDADIAHAEQHLGIAFRPDYRQFLQQASDVSVGTIEPSLLPPGAGHCDLFSIAHEAWAHGIDRGWLPICRDNGDYYCMTETGEIVFCSHDGVFPSQRWATLADWIEDVWLPTASF